MRWRRRSFDRLAKSTRGTLRCASRAGAAGPVRAHRNGSCRRRGARPWCALRRAKRFVVARLFGRRLSPARLLDRHVVGRTRKRFLRPRVSLACPCCLVGVERLYDSDLLQEGEVAGRARHALAHGGNSFIERDGGLALQGVRLLLPRVVRALLVPPPKGGGSSVRGCR